MKQNYKDKRKNRQAHPKNKRILKASSDLDKVKGKYLAKIWET
jgi:hypothetical protein